MGPADHGTAGIGQVRDVDIASTEAVGADVSSDSYHSSFAISSAAKGS